MSLWFVLFLSLLPGAGNFAGGMIAEFGKTTDRLLNWALHAASGIVIAIVAVELMPEALKSLAGWWIAAAFGAGGVTYVLVEMGIEKLQSGGEGDGTGMWMIYVAVAVDLTSDGLMLGSGAAVSSSMAIVLAAGQVLADVPEGYASIANFRNKGLPRDRRILLSASFILFCVGAALLSYLLLRGADEGPKMAALCFVAGLLTVAAVEDMLEEAHEANSDNRRSVLAFVGGFVLFTLVSVGLETVAGQGQSGSAGQSTARGAHLQ
ncbi:MAG: peptidoglycan-binding protein [Marinovum algicola]|uniref:ZIP family metal transporter n=1 Tax=Marinovum algicola TaxID=42444 RepID=UPI0032EDA6D1